MFFEARHLDSQGGQSRLEGVAQAIPAVLLNTVLKRLRGMTIYVGVDLVQLLIIKKKISF